MRIVAALEFLLVLGIGWVIGWVFGEFHGEDAGFDRATYAPRSEPQGRWKDEDYR